MLLDSLTVTRIADMTGQYAADIVNWRYPAPYQCCDQYGADPAYFLDTSNGIHALADDQGALIGYRSFGPDGRVNGGA